MRYLVIGGAGRVGAAVAARLGAAGHDVRVMSRRPGSSPFQAVVGDLRDAAAVDEALRDTDGVVVSVEPPYDDAGAEAVMHGGVQVVSTAAERHGAHVVLVSQIYITRPEAQPPMAGIVAARGRGEHALRASGAPYTIVRPSWLTDEPGAISGLRLEQGDTGDGEVSREDVADACVHAFEHRQARGLTFELYNGPGSPIGDWGAAFDALTPDFAASP